MIVISPYCAAWPDSFDAIATALRAHLGALASRVDHIGSTAVPGLAAKDIIDIQVTVAALGGELERALEDAGFARLAHIVGDHVPPGGTPGADWEKWLFKPPMAPAVAPEVAGPDVAPPAHGVPAMRPVNVHVRIAGRANQRYALLFRDYLRAHPAVAAAYGAIKVRLAALHPGDVEAYYDVKDPVCDLIIGAAEGWAASAGWQPA